ncbi:MAG: archaellin/type IV pilin N-terminal domain-containing protein [Methanoregula sp.]|uniref:archaellin/type IV pilin N-terminal domain-containing protein n=1 Tax=Methanoregula sp. TaxID=2052170 RepID=UPI003C368FA5
MSSCKHNDEGFTGLEAAIVLIAFVVVAAVFSYVVLGAGFFTTQKAQQTVHTGVNQATSAVEPSGPVSVQADSNGDGGIGNITFYLQLAAGGNAVDMSKVTYTVSTPTKVETFTNSSVTYSWVQQNTPIDPGQTTHAGLLNPREMVLVSVSPGFGATDLGVNTQFIVQVNPPIGAALPIARTVPAGMTSGTWYEVY